MKRSTFVAQSIDLHTLMFSPSESDVKFDVWPGPYVYIFSLKVKNSCRLKINSIFPFVKVTERLIFVSQGNLVDCLFFLKLCGLALIIFLCS